MHERPAAPDTEREPTLRVRPIYEEDEARCVAFLRILLTAGVRARARRAAMGVPLGDAQVADDFEERRG
jgi:hypothetical protein